MFTAQEARNISNKAYKEQIDAELASIMPEIEAAMRKGEYSCWIDETNISWGEYMAVKVREILNEYEIEEILTEYLGAFDSMLQIIDTDDGEKVRVVIFDKYDHSWINGTTEREYGMDKTNFKFIILNSPFNSDIIICDDNELKKILKELIEEMSISIEWWYNSVV